MDRYELFAFRVSNEGTRNLLGSSKKKKKGTKDKRKQNDNW